MHVHERNPWRTLIALSIFFIVVIIGFITMHRPEFTFKKDMSQSLQDVNQEDAYFNPWHLDSVIHNQNNNVILIDIRDKFIYGQGNIPGSENIPAFDLTKTENFERLKDLRNGNITVVLYGEDQLQANGPWMLFRQLGFDNVKILPGGYQYYKLHKDNLAETQWDSDFIKEFPKYDFADIISKLSGTDASQVSVKKEPVEVTRQAKTKATAGGC